MKLLSIYIKLAHSIAMNFELEVFALKEELCKRIHADDLADRQFMRMLDRFATDIYNSALDDIILLARKKPDDV